MFTPHSRSGKHPLFGPQEILFAILILAASAMALLLMTTPARAANPIPGYLIQVSGMRAGNPSNGGHSFGHLAYNGTWCCPANRFRTLANGDKLYDASGLFAKNPLGAGKGLGDEHMHLLLDGAGAMTVERTTGFGLIGRWTGTGTLALQSQGVQCECSAAVVKVSLVPDITPYLP